MNDTFAESPRILSSGWGQMEVEGLAPGRDFKLWPGGGRAWDWNETGTGHTKGVQPEDVMELIEKGCKTIILTTGRMHRLKVPKQTLALLREHSIEAIVKGTKGGITTYNEYQAKGQKVGGLFHTTC